MCSVTSRGCGEDDCSGLADVRDGVVSLQVTDITGQMATDPKVTILRKTAACFGPTVTVVHCVRQPDGAVTFC